MGFFLRFFSGSFDHFSSYSNCVMHNLFLSGFHLTGYFQGRTCSGVRWTKTFGPFVSFTIETKCNIID